MTSAYLGHDVEAVAHLIKCLAKTHPVVSRIHLNEAKQGLLNRPLPRHTLFDPVAGDGKISASIASLPCFTCQADFTSHGGTLTRMSVERKIKE